MSRFCGHLFFLLIVIPMFAISGAGAPYPVIIDADIGSDMDDVWALALALCSPELDLKMVVTDGHDARERAKIAAKFLERVQRTDVAVGIGVKTSDSTAPQTKWAEDYDLSQYQGKVYEDGVQGMIEVIKNTSEPVRLVITGPCPNIPVLLQRCPDVFKKVRVFAMSGSVKKGYGGLPSPDAEYNVRKDIRAARKLYAASWRLTIAPLDVSGLIDIRGDQYQHLMRTDSILIRTLLENYRAWAKEGRSNAAPDVRSTTLYDAAAVYLAIENRFCRMEEIQLSVDNRGYTVVDPRAPTIEAAMEWKDRQGFIDWMVNRLKQGIVNKHP
ncbi:MAG: nucleoside hydrolase [Candidatus Omnitrophica bacterium]|nr:nucleoside hydrolase [Candidatus Omnitrophota bacterium]